MLDVLQGTALNAAGGLFTKAIIVAPPLRDLQDLTTAALVSAIR
ncbi:MAG: hypothetical protein ACXWU5_01645 [Rhodoplanes sp.]